MKYRKKNIQEFKDFYATLDIPKNASDKAIKKAFRKFARKYHPDHNPDDPEATKKFMEVAKAYKILMSQDSRDEVDAMIISEYCNTLLGVTHRTDKEKEKYATEFLRLLKS